MTKTNHKTAAALRAGAYIRILMIEQAETGTNLSVQRSQTTAQADRLNEAGHTTKEDARFTSKQVSRILQHRKLYSGAYTYGGISAAGQYPNIIQRKH